MLWKTHRHTHSLCTARTKSPLCIIHTHAHAHADTYSKQLFCIHLYRAQSLVRSPSSWQSWRPTSHRNCECWKEKRITCTLTPAAVGILVMARMEFLSFRHTSHRYHHRRHHHRQHLHHKREPWRENDRYASVHTYVHTQTNIHANTYMHIHTRA